MRRKLEECEPAFGQFEERVAKLGMEIERLNTVLRQKMEESTMLQR